jgi:hypothetical protein
VDNKPTPKQAAANVVNYVRAANASVTNAPSVSDDAYARAQRTVEQQLKRIAKS